MTGCAVCRQPIPADEGHDDRRTVMFRNQHAFRACLRCWCIWPDEGKVFPRVGYGRPLEGDQEVTPHTVRRFPGEEEWTRQVLIDVARQSPMGDSIPALPQLGNEVQRAA
jgi:hypothetical protein